MAACVQPRQAEKANMSAIVCGAGCRLVDCSPMCWHSVQWGHARVPRARPSCCHIALCMLCPLRRHQGDWLPVWAVEAAHHGAHARADRQRVRWQRPRPRSQTASSTAVAAPRGARRTHPLPGADRRVECVCLRWTCRQCRPGWGGSAIRPEATGYGVVFLAEEVLRDQDEEGGVKVRQGRGRERVRTDESSGGWLGLYFAWLRW